MKGVKDVKSVTIARSARSARFARAAALALFTSLTLFTSMFVWASIEAQTQKPVFRSRTELLQLDVTVLDKDGRPVRGLKSEDFVIVEDKKPQTIEAFTAIDIPDAPTGGPVWRHTTNPDVTSNEIDNQRIFVLVIDDARSMGLVGPMRLPDLWAIREMKKSVEFFIKSLSPVDLVALVLTNQTKFSQNLTADHARLITAIQRYPADGGGILNSNMMGADPCLGEKYSVGTIQGVVNNLAAVPDRRKAVVYFGGHMPWIREPALDKCFTYARWTETFAAAQQAHVTINPVHTMGAAPESYRIVADHTGGHAVVGSNDFLPGLRQIFLENSSYYLMAYSPTNALEDGRFRVIDVTVKGRPDLDVRTRRNYWAAKSKVGDKETPPPPPQTEALAGILPLSKLTLRVTAAPFAIAGTERSNVTLALGVKQPALESRTLEEVEVLIKAFSADGDPKGSDAQTIPITIPAARRDSDISRYELLAYIELPKPGKYELRLSAHSSISDTRGSVYVDVEVPDFRREKLSLSGVVLNSALPSAPAAPARALRDVVPLIPTTERAFTASDIVTALLRIYQGGGDKLAPVNLKATIQDAAGKFVLDKADTLGPERFNAERASDYQFRLPLPTLTPGEYLLTLEASSGKISAKRDVRFEVTGARK